jgi:hypothetical protein
MLALRSIDASLILARPLQGRQKLSPTPLNACQWMGGHSPQIRLRQYV